MRKSYIIIMSLFVFCVNSFAQSKLKEADFIGDVRIINVDSTTTNLEKTNVQIKLKPTASKIWWGFESDKALLEVPGKFSSRRLPIGSEIQFIVRVADNNLDPMSIVSIFSYVIKGKKRRANLGKVNSLMGNTSAGLKRLIYEGKKYGEHSYIIKFSSNEPGEYGIIVNNPNLQRDDSNLVVYSFGIDA